MVKFKNKAHPDVALPRFTTITRKGEKTMAKGWSDAGKLRFKRLTNIVKQQRQDVDWLNERRKYILKKAGRDSKRKRKRDNNNVDDTINKEMNREEKEDWNDFINESINDFNWINNSVAV